MKARRLLAFADWCVGADARARVFEPLVADWAREWHDARDASAVKRLKVVLHGGLAFMTSIAVSATPRIVTLPPAIVLTRAAVLFTAAAAAGIVALATPIVLLRLARVVPPPAPPLFTEMWASTVGELAPVTMAAALVPLLILMPTPAARPWQSAQFVLAAALATFVACAWIIPLANRPLQMAITEQRRAQTIADNRAGRYTYPGTVLRQLAQRRPPPTAEEPARLADAYTRWVANLPSNMTLPQLLRAPAAQDGRGSTGERLRRIFTTPLVTIAFGLMGAGLATLGASLVRAGVWWAVVLVLLIATHAPYSRVPLWVVAVAAALSGALLIVRHGQGPRPLPSP